MIIKSTLFLPAKDIHFTGRSGNHRIRIAGVAAAVQIILCLPRRHQLCASDIESRCHSVVTDIYNAVVAAAPRRISNRIFGKITAVTVAVFLHRSILTGFAEISENLVGRESAALIAVPTADVAAVTAAYFIGLADNLASSSENQTQMHDENLYYFFQRTLIEYVEPSTTSN